MGTQSETRPAHHAIPPGTRFYAVGDIHGRNDLLERLHRQIRTDSQDSAAMRKVVVYVGDYIDRGPGSRQVVESLLADPLPGFEAVHLKGNHEEFLLNFLEDSSVASFWVMNGGGATFESYDVSAPSYLFLAGNHGTLRDEFLAAIEDSHLEFFGGLRTSYEEGGYLFVHAGVRPGVPFDQQREHDLLWIREEFLCSEAGHGRRVVHGHTLVSEPEVRANRIGIDTGAYMSERLTALVLEGERVRFLST